MVAKGKGRDTIDTVILIAELGAIGYGVYVLASAWNKPKSLATVEPPRNKPLPVWGKDVSWTPQQQATWADVKYSYQNITPDAAAWDAGVIGSLEAKERQATRDTMQHQIEEVLKYFPPPKDFDIYAVFGNPQAILPTPAQIAQAIVLGVAPETVARAQFEGNALAAMY